MPRMVAIDTNTLVWGIRRKGPDEKVKRARWLFHYLEEEENQVIVPSVVVSEYLTYSDAETHVDIINELNESFIIAPFDVRCASLAATLFREGLDERPRKQPGGRSILRADAMIIATAKIHGAIVLYTDDKACRTMAKKVMVANELPDIAPDLFQQ